jgi:1-acyl-sn-glycerol-3-phosphate acyltransferase
LISPEGTRSWDGRLLPMKRGAFLLARAARRPIVCVIVRGAHERLPRGSFAVRPGAIEIELSEPIEIDDETEPQLESLVAATLSGPRT